MFTEKINLTYFKGAAWKDVVKLHFYFIVFFGLAYLFLAFYKKFLTLETLYAYDLILVGTYSISVVLVYFGVFFKLPPKKFIDVFIISLITLALYSWGLFIDPWEWSISAMLFLISAFTPWLCSIGVHKLLQQRRKKRESLYIEDI